MTARPGRPRLVDPGALGPAPIHTFPAGEWPVGIPREGGKERDVISRWAIARAGTVQGFYGDPVWFEHGVDSCGNAIEVPIWAYGIWPVCAPCPLTIDACYEHGCNRTGRCERPREKG